MSLSWNPLKYKVFLLNLCLSSTHTCKGFFSTTDHAKDEIMYSLRGERRFIRNLPLKSLSIVHKLRHGCFMNELMGGIDLKAKFVPLMISSMVS